MSEFRKELINPIDVIDRYWPDADKSHITYDDNLKSRDRDYWRIEGCGGDGTLAFSIMMMQKLLIPLMNKTTYCKATEPDWSNVVDVRYTVGKIRHSTVYGRVALRCGGIYPGQRERVRLPVVCEYVMKGDINHV